MKSRTKMLRVRITEEEYNSISNAARGQKLSEYLRSVLFPKRVPPPSEKVPLLISRDYDVVPADLPEWN